MQRMIVRLERLAQLAHGLLSHFTDARVIHPIQAEQLVMIQPYQSQRRTALPW